LKIVMNTFGPAKYNKLLLKQLRSLSSDGRTKGTYQDPKSSNQNLIDFAFVNEFSFARMSPPYPLKYKQTESSWQTYLKQRNAFN
jgi:hypothetical protein